MLSIEIQDDQCRPNGLKEHLYPPGARDLRTYRLALSSIKHKEIKRSLALQDSKPQEPDDGFSDKCSYSPEGNIMDWCV